MIAKWSRSFVHYLMGAQEERENKRKAPLLGKHEEHKSFAAFSIPRPHVFMFVFFESSKLSGIIK